MAKKALKKKKPKQRAKRKTRTSARKSAARKKPARRSGAKRASAPKGKGRSRPVAKKAAPRPKIARKAPPARPARPAKKAEAKKAEVRKPETKSVVPAAAPKAAPKAVAPPARSAVKAAANRFAPPTPSPSPVAVKPKGPKPLRIRARPVPASTHVAVHTGPPIDLGVMLSRLHDKKQEILKLYLSDLRSGQESNDSPTEDIVDRANNAYSRELNFSISDAERALMLQVDEAIRRVESGTYASCANCGNPIARPRLEAVPWARYCISCQELLEQGMLSEA